jgi:hypothetical protein
VHWLGWFYLAAVLALFTFKILPYRSAFALHVLGAPLYLAWALADYGSFLCATTASLAFVQVEPAPFDILVPILLVTGLVGRQLRPRWSAGVALIVVSVAWGLLSLPWWEDIGRGARFLGITLYLCVTMLVMSWNGGRAALRAFKNGYLIAAVAAVGVGFLALVWQNGHTSHLLYRTPVLVWHPLAYRVQAFFKDPNVFGAFLVPAILISIDRAVRSSDRGVKGAAGPVCMLLACSLGLLVSYSRGALINAVCAIAAYTIYLVVRRSRWAAKGLALVALAGVVAVVFVTAAGLWPAVAVRYRLQPYDRDRIQVQESALASAMRPWTAAPAPSPEAPPGSPPLATDGAGGPPPAAPESPGQPAPEATGRGTTGEGAPSPSGLDTGLVDQLRGSFVSLAWGLSRDLFLSLQPGSRAIAVVVEALSRLPVPAVSSWVERFIVGIGPGQFESRFPRSAHSIYVRFFTEGGACDLGVFLAGLALIALGSIRAMRAMRWDSMGMLVAAILLGILAQGATIDTLHWRHFWVFLGLLPLASRQTASGQSPLPQPGDRDL